MNTDRASDFERDELSVAYDRVRDPQDWRARIDSVIPDADFTQAHAAVMYFTATELRIVGRPNPGYMRVVATGYREGPAGP
ncbi:MAG: hypothetical protein IID48_00360 [Proteobacteria bacterium]|nr:hypothetical protein [Pseudomonadota bacterium]